MWFFTVPSLRNSWAAISRLVDPRATSRRISTSRAVRPLSTAGGAPGPSAEVSRVATAASKGATPRCASRTASVSSVAPRSLSR
jgi:hypothetical protein